MSLNHLGAAITGIAAKHSISVSKLAAKVDVHQSTISRAVNGARLDLNTMKALVSKLSKSEALQVMIAHCKDELERCGLPPDSIQMKSGIDPYDDMGILTSEYYKDDELREILHFYANIARRNMLSRGHVAEPESKYLTNEDS